MKKIPSVNDVMEIAVRGPWPTKSHGSLNVLTTLSYEEMSSFFCYESTELQRIKSDIRGFRVYNVSNLSKGAVGGNEWHRIKKEIVFATKGSFEIYLKDSLKNERTVLISPSSQGVYIPPFVLHTYKALEDNSELTVITNTLYNVDDPNTYDVYEASMLGI